MAAHAPASTCAHFVERSAFAGDEEAIGILLKAARAAALRAPLTAGRWLLAAIRLLPADADPDRRLGLLVEAATALTSGGAYEESLASLEEALTLVAPDQATKRADLIAKLAYANRRSGRPFDSPKLIELATSGAESAGFGVSWFRTGMGHREAPCGPRSKCLCSDARNRNPGPHRPSS